MHLECSHVVIFIGNKKFRRARHRCWANTIKVCTFLGYFATSRLLKNLMPHLICHCPHGKLFSFKKKALKFFRLSKQMVLLAWQLINFKWLGNEKFLSLAIKNNDPCENYKTTLPMTKHYSHIEDLNKSKSWSKTIPWS